MKKIESSYKNMALVLTGLALFAGITLTSVYSLTRNTIEQSDQSLKDDAIKAVLPPFDHVSSKPVELINGVEITRVYKAYDKNNVFVGAAVESSSNNGYRGPVNIMVGFNNKGIIVNYVVLEQHETQGLGAQMENWFKMNISHQDIRGKNPATANMNVSKDGGDIDAISGATISSRAFLFAVRNAYFAYTSNQDNGLKSTLDSSTKSLNKVLPESKKGMK